MDNKSALIYAKSQLKDFSESYNIDSQIFIMDILNINKIDLLTKDFILTESQISRLNDYIYRRKLQEPVAYIINKIEFMGLDFYVDRNTLIPRSDTEVLVEKILEINKNNRYSSFLEIGIGTGCISISLSKFSSLVGNGVDIINNCVEISIKNAIANNVNDKVHFFKSDIFENIKDKYDIIVSNPPYINKKDMDELLPNVKEYEPHIALFGGDNGLYFYENIIGNAKKYLNAKGMLAFEIGYDQGKSIAKLLELQGFIDIKVYKDLYRHDRVVIGFLK